VRVATYARVSTKSQEARGTIGSQLELLRQTMSRLGHEIVRQYQDDGYSGARLDRPGLDALRDAAEAGLFEQVWCLTPDRMARAVAVGCGVCGLVASTARTSWAPTVAPGGGTSETVAVQAFGSSGTPLPIWCPFASCPNAVWSQ
jgi:hypothetical protein